MLVERRWQRLPATATIAKTAHTISAKTRDRCNRASRGAPPPAAGPLSFKTSFLLATPRLCGLAIEQDREAGREGRAFRTFGTWREPRAPPVLSPPAMMGRAWHFRPQR